MLIRRRLTVLFLCAISMSAFSQYGIYSSRGLLEKAIYYIDEDGKEGTCTFWSLHLGKHTCKLNKQFPGEGTVALDAEVNFNFLSSLYIEGKGYSGRGKVDADAKFAVMENGAIKNIEPEQLEFVYDYGAKANVSGAGLTDLFLHVDNNQLVIKRMLVRIFAIDKLTKDLKFDKDVAIQAFSFTKKGLQEARAAAKGGN